MSIMGAGRPGQTLRQDQVREIIARAASDMPVEGKKVLAIIPDHTRTCPLPLVSRALHESLAGKARTLDFLIALGTHPPMSEAAIDKLLGIEPGTRSKILPGSKVFNHDWKNPDALCKIGTFSRDRIAAMMDPVHEQFAVEVDVTINKHIFEYDLLLIVGPVFPHEVVGFSGGAKYFFPGICGEELLNFFHWMGALITIPRMIGVKDTPVRRLLHEAMDMIPVEKRALCMVVKDHDLAGLYYGPPKEAWNAAVDLSDQVHIIYKDRSYSSILSRAPEMYDELWVGAKCMYKMECVVEDGGELIIYAPHIHEIAAAHGKIIQEIGYHCLPYFVEQWDRFKHHPWGVLAHSTHVRGIGEFLDNVEAPRINVTLATGIPEELCRAVNLGYRDPVTIDITDWQDHEDEGKLYVPKAGEMLYRLRPDIAPDWQRCEGR
jgi:nickel-dependent lactate racemase